MAEPHALSFDERAGLWYAGDERMHGPEWRTAEGRGVRMEFNEGFETIRPVPQQRIREKLDAYMARQDYAGAERHLLYWLEEANLGGDRRGELMVRNELIGHYRKTGEKEKALSQIGAALALLPALDFEGTVSAGTTYVNAATALNAFGENQRAMGLFERARAVYEQGSGVSPELLGGLYNNMGLCCASLSRYAEAHALYDLAMAQMAQAENGELEQAVTCLNRANAVEAQWGLEQGESQIFALLDRAQALLDTPGIPRDGYYAFVCEKCAPTFAYYGYFLAARELEERAETIYAGA